MIYIIGDTHGEMEINKLSQNNNAPMKESDIVIILGDFGLIFNNIQTNEEKWWLKWLEGKPYYTLFIDGNHDNHNMIYSYPKVFLNENNILGRFRRINSKVFYIPRGNIFYINGISFLGIGGAMSIDRCSRIKHITWWETELINVKEQRHIQNQLEQYDYVDYILTHTCPEFIFEFIYDKFKFTRFYDPTSKILNHVYDCIDFKHWFFGHLHIDYKINEEFTAVYNNFIAINNEDDIKNE